MLHMLWHVKHFWIHNFDVKNENALQFINFFWIVNVSQLQIVLILDSAKLRKLNRSSKAVILLVLQLNNNLSLKELFKVENNQIRDNSFLRLQ